MSKLYLVFINYHEFSGASGIHIFHLANALRKLGVGACAYIPGDPASVDRFGAALFDVSRFSFIEAARRIYSLKNEGARVLIHAWTPRERVRKFTTRLARLTGVRYCAHLEDNERHIAESYARLAPRASLLNLRRRWLARQNLTDPRRMPGFLAASAGVTCLTERLLEDCPDNVPRLMFWPGCEEEFFDILPQPDKALRAALGIAPDECVILYPGATHPLNLSDMASLYGAAGALYAKGRKIRLLRIGADHRLGREDFGASPARPWLTHLGDRPARELPALIAAADMLAQPGKPDAFNEYRLPSKLTLFLASGRPVILPRSNIGLHMADGVNCLLTSTGESDELAAQLDRLIASPQLRARIGEGGRAFASAHFRWPQIAERLIPFYEAAAGGARP